MRMAICETMVRTHLCGTSESGGRAEQHNMMLLEEEFKMLLEHRFEFQLRQYLPVNRRDGAESRIVHI
jgi:hypothetical protein